MHNRKIIDGKFIKIYQLNDFFYHVSLMLLEKFDNEKYEKTLFLLGVYCFDSIKDIKVNYNGFKIVVYQLEQLMAGGNWHNVNSIMENIKDADEIWDYDPLNIAYLNENKIKTNRFLPLLHTNSLKKIEENKNPYFDVLFYGLINDRRYRILKKIQSDLYNQIKINWVFGCVDMDKSIFETKIILNIHAFEPYHRQEQVRMFYPLINGKTIVSEASQVNNMEGCIIECPVDDISRTLLTVANTTIWKDFGPMASKEFETKSKRILDEQ